MPFGSEAIISSTIALVYHLWPTCDHSPRYILDPGRSTPSSPNSRAIFASLAFFLDDESHRYLEQRQIGAKPFRVMVHPAVSHATRPRTSFPLTLGRLTLALWRGVGLA